MRLDQPKVLLGVGVITLVVYIADLTLLLSGHDNEGSWFTVVTAWILSKVIENFF